MLFVLFIFMLLVFKVLCDYCPNNTIELLGTSKCYSFSTNSTHFSLAEYSCNNLGGYLVSIHSEGENKIFFESAKKYFGDKNELNNTEIWLGSNNTNHDAIWKWMDGTPFGYNNWKRQPPNFGGFCAVMTLIDGFWMARDCTFSNPFSCEFLMLPDLDTSTIPPPSTEITKKVTNEFTSIKPFDTTEIITSANGLHYGSSSISPITTKVTESVTTTSMTSLETTQSTNSITPFDITTLKTSSMITIDDATTISSSTTTKIPNNSESSVKWWIIGAVLIAFLAFATIIILYFLRKRYQQKMFEKLQETIKVKMELSPLEVKLSHDERLTKQLDPKNVIIDFNTVLGRGSIATVYKVFIKGKIKPNLIENKIKFVTEYNSNAAIKVPKTFDHDEVEQFVRELDTFITLGTHSHIITFIGWTLYHDIPALVTELADKNLLQFVNSFRGEILPIKTIISILWQVSQALEHVSSLNMVHRDVACRNILLTKNNVAKLADFGLCCHCDESFTYQATLHKRLPLKWLSIEALVDRIFSEKSDVWSFGILCFEIFSFGAVPYATLSNEEMLEFLQAGNRLEKTSNTPDAIYSLMLDFWKMDPCDRPKFEEIENNLRTILENETASYGYLTLGNEE